MLKPSKVFRKRACFQTTDPASCHFIAESPMLEPTDIPQRRLPRFGFHGHTEKLNGRAAMLGFIALLAVEIKLGHGLLIW